MLGDTYVSSFMALKCCCVLCLQSPVMQSVTETNLPDLLHLACNSKMTDGAMLLRQQDTERLHVLEGTAPDKQALVYQLLQTCLVRKHVDVAKKLLKLPAAQCFGGFWQTQRSNILSGHKGRPFSLHWS